MYDIKLVNYLWMIDVILFFNFILYNLLIDLKVWCIFLMVLVKVEIDWYFVDDMLFYVSYLCGIKGGNWVFLVFFLLIMVVNFLVFLYKLEVLIDYEIGMKIEFFDYKVWLNISVFYYVYDNY